jgi:hypothetical protein
LPNAFLAVRLPSKTAFESEETEEVVGFRRAVGLQVPKQLLGQHGIAGEVIPFNQHAGVLKLRTPVPLVRGPFEDLGAGFRIAGVLQEDGVVEFPDRFTCIR